MDWIKVKVNHVEYDMKLASDEVFRLWISAMIYTAAIEKMPTNEQLDVRLGKKGHQNLRKTLKKNGTNLDKILEKVLEDVNYIQAHRKHNRDYMRGLRCGRPQDRHVDSKVMVKRRGEEIRGDGKLIISDEKEIKKIHEDTKNLIKQLSADTKGGAK